MKLHRTLEDHLWFESVHIWLNRNNLIFRQSSVKSYQPEAKERVTVADLQVQIQVCTAHFRLRYLSLHAPVCCWPEDLFSGLRLYTSNQDFLKISEQVKLPSQLQDHLLLPPLEKVNSSLAWLLQGLFLGVKARLGFVTPSRQRPTMDEPLNSSVNIL